MNNTYTLGNYIFTIWAKLYPGRILIGIRNEDERGIETEVGSKGGSEVAEVADMKGRTTTNTHYFFKKSHSSQYCA